MIPANFDEAICYQALTGSRQFGTNLENSDTDYITITSNPVKLLNERAKGIDLHCYKPESFIYLIFEDERHPDTWRAIYALFSEPVIETEFSKYFLANREQIVSSNLPRFSTIILEYIEHISAQGNNKIPLGVKFPKRTTTSMIFLNAYIRYATENISFEEAFKLSEEFKEYLMGIRQQAIPYEEQMEKLKSMLAKAEEVKEFYNKEPDLDTFYKIKNEMQELLGINMRGLGLIS
jgi:hypothetical protein